MTPPGDQALWFMYEPILMSKQSWDKLNKEQQDALMKAGKKSEEFFNTASKKLDTDMVENRDARRLGRDFDGFLEDAEVDALHG